MPPRPKYQIFISSTFTDLHEEREAVTWGILSARHIPAGMENFTATDERGWQTIKSVIDSSDYYVLLIAGRYGSVSDDGRSWTHREYEYAVSLGIPVIGFIRKSKSITADNTEDDPALRKKLADFIASVKGKHLTESWDTSDYLVGLVTNALNNKIKDDEDSGNGRPGWFRGRPAAEPVRPPGEAEAADAKSPLLVEEAAKPPNFAVHVPLAALPELVLVDLNEIPFPDKVISSLHFYTYDDKTGATSRERIRNRQFDAFLLGALQPVRIGIRNGMALRAVDVSIDMEFTGIFAISCERVVGSDLKQSGAEKQGTGLLHRVRRRSWKRTSVQMLVPLIEAGEVVYLPTIFLCGEPAGPDIQEGTQMNFNMNYTIQSVLTRPASGLIAFESTLGPVQLMTILNLSRGIQALNKRGVPPSDDALGSLTNLALPQPEPD